jgi:hypothetical protein
MWETCSTNEKRKLQPGKQKERENLVEQLEDGILISELIFCKRV